MPEKQGFASQSTRWLNNHRQLLEVASAISDPAKVRLAQFTVSKLATESGVSEPTIYNHFPGGIADVSREVVDQRLTWFENSVDHVSGAGGRVTKSTMVYLLNAFVGYDNALIRHVRETGGDDFCSRVGAKAGLAFDAESTGLNISSSKRGQFVAVFLTLFFGYVQPELNFRSLLGSDIQADLVVTTISESVGELFDRLATTEAEDKFAFLDEARRKLNQMEVKD